MPNCRTSIIFFSILFVSVYSSFAQEKILIDKPATLQLAQDVTGLFYDGDSKDAFDLMSAYWPYNQQELQGLSQRYQKESETIESRFGNPFRIVEGNLETVASFRIRKTFYLVFEYYALRYMSEFHEASAGWILSGFKYDDKISEDYSILEK
jgi:hypothetical protein